MVRQEGGCRFILDIKRPGNSEAVVARLFIFELGDRNWPEPGDLVRILFFVCLISAGFGKRSCLRVTGANLTSLGRSGVPPPTNLCYLFITSLMI